MLKQVGVEYNMQKKITPVFCCEMMSLLISQGICRSLQHELCRHNRLDILPPDLIKGSMHVGLWSHWQKSLFDHLLPIYTKVARIKPDTFDIFFGPTRYIEYSFAECANVHKRQAVTLCLPYRRLAFFAEPIIPTG